MRARFSRWDGTQRPEDEQIDDAEIMDQISDDLLAGAGPERALRSLLRRGIPGRLAGLDELGRRVAEARRRWAEQTNLNSAVAQFAGRLGSILDQEKAALSTMASDDARAREIRLDMLPASLPAAIQELMAYRFADPGAQERFDQLLADIRREAIQAQFGQLMGSVRNVRAQDVSRMRQMVAELNQMIRARHNGQAYDFEGFMQRYADMFPERPENLDELLETLANRMAAMSRLMANLTPGQRQQLEDLLGAVLDDMDLEFEMAMLRDQLQSLAPELPWNRPASGYSEEPMGLSEIADAMERLGEMEQLEQALKGRYAGAVIQDVDEQKLRKALDEEAAADLKELKRIESALERSGLLARDAGRLELTARGIRRLGEAALVKVFEVLRHDRPGGHEDRSPGGPAEPTGATRPWRFEDPGEICVQRTVFNAVTRSASRGRPGAVRLHPDDFELNEAESRTRTATALLLDLSFSMPLRGHWVAAKKMALALHALIEGKYPQDHLYLIGFSDYARRLEPRELTVEGTIERVYGTNMQHAFLLARRLLGQHPGSSRQVIMVTDGEPTAHLVEGTGGGVEAAFRWPPTSQTIHKTLAEASRLSSSGITLNIYMLEEDPELTRFMDELARLTGGRVFHAAGQDIGRFVLRDFVRYR